MAKVLEDTNQGTHLKKVPYDFALFRKVGSPFMATLSTPRFTMGFVNFVVFNSEYLECP